ncbi:hypothetical protein [Sorangium sp. So ce1182]|uniref:hypothetical protein n=1 Tax=Sorangium sp. So ce1182 TaxID=3133334 RepID=UPI003F63AACB
MSSTEMRPAPFFPLDLPLAHIDALGMAWIARRQALFGTTAARGALARLDRRVSNHVRALRAGMDESVRVALLALHDTWAPRAFAGAYVLLHLAPNMLLGMLRDLLPTARFSLLDALRHAPTEVSRDLPLDHPVLLDAASMQIPIAASVLLELLAHPSEDFRRAALLAAARSGSRGRPLLPGVERSAKESEPPERLIAFYAVGRIGGAARLDALHELLWERAVLDVHPLLVAAAFGCERAVSAIMAIPDAALRPEHIHALGLAGRPESIEFLVGVLRHRTDLAEEAAHSLYLVMGDNVPSLPAREPLTDSTLDLVLLRAGALRAGAPGVRLHLGHRLDSALDVMSHAWLRSLRMPCFGDVLANALPDWLLGGGYAPAGWPRLSLGPRQGAR